MDQSQIASDALRGHTLSEVRDTPVTSKVGRSGRQRGTEARRVPHDEIVAIAQAIVLPEGVTDLRMTVHHDHGDKLPNGNWSGLGGKTMFGPVFVIGGRLESEPIHLFESQKDAIALHAMLTGDEGDLWHRKQRRLEALAAAEIAEAEAVAILKENAKTVRRANEGGGGSSRPSRSSAKRTASSGPGLSRRERLRAASKTTS